MEFKKVNIITGHYGSGKTNLAVNMALDLSSKGEKVTVVDLDIVNPYFRTADFESLFNDNNIRLIAPMYANSNLDIPAIGFDIESIVNGDGYVIIDVGGDDEGAKALGRYAGALKNTGYEFIYVINRYRYLTGTPEENSELLRDIQAASGLCATAIVNNSNLGCETQGDTIRNSIGYAEKTAELCGLPLIANCAEKRFASDIKNAYPIEIYVKKLWE